MHALTNQPGFINNTFHLHDPVLFNCLKHHAGYVSWLIRNYEFSDMIQKRGLKEVLNFIGKSQMDFYTGNLTPHQITDEIKRNLESKDLLKKENYLSWISTATNSYRKISLRDGSVWILLHGKHADRYIHIHPGRYSPFTIRVRSETLKTAIAVLTYCRQYGERPTEIDIINDVRAKILNLSPVKYIDRNRGMGRMISILAGQSISLVMAIAAIVPSATAVVI